MVIGAMQNPDYFIAKRPIPGNKDDECGDTGMIKEFNNKVFISIVDVLGHGKEAHEIANECEDFLIKNYRDKGLIEIMKALHGHIRGSRGAAVGMSFLDLKTGDLRYAGVGNTAIRKFGSNRDRIISRSGIVGYVMPGIREETMKLYDGDVLVLYTDGVADHFELEEYQDILKDDAGTIAANIIQKFGKADDDAACIALKYKYQ